MVEQLKKKLEKFGFENAFLLILKTSNQVNEDKIKF